MSPRKSLLIEFNELSPTLIDRFISAGQLPNFSKFRSQASQFTTLSNEQDKQLEPWVEWVTVHTGQPLKMHNSYKLGDNDRMTTKTIGQILSDCGIPIGIYSSMNLRHSNVVGYCIPDPWDKNGTTNPVDFQPYYDLTSAMVRESSRTHETTASDYFELLSFLLTHGLALRTALKAARQIMAELFDRSISWRRAMILDHLNYDMARYLNAKYDPAFATFFSNSTAHFQHYFWQNLDPDLFVGREDIDRSSKSNAILAGYKNLDDLLGRFMTDYPDRLLVLCTALSQEPWTTTKKQTYRPIDFSTLLDFAGISSSDVEVQPIMAEEFRVRSNSSSTLSDVFSKLSALTFANGTLLRITRGNGDLLVGCAATSGIGSDEICSNALGQQTQFGQLFYPIHGIRSGRHNPLGVLWIRNGKPTAHSEPVSLCAIAPTLLRFHGVAIPSTMQTASIPID